MDIIAAKKWIFLFCTKIVENKLHLNELDTLIGDGDHGSNMVKAVKKVFSSLNNNYENLADFFKQIGLDLLFNAGGASGVLYGSAFIEMSKTSLTSTNITDLIKNATSIIAKRGGSDLGEKTMIDIWAFACKHLEDKTLTNELLYERLDYTKNLKATKGKASFLGDLSVGYIDPGSQSSVYLFEALIDVL